MPAFARYIGIDYSGAETAESSLKGLRVFIADAEAPPSEVLPPPSPKKYWTRRALAYWLERVLAEPIPTLVGIDHSFSFPLAYFRKYCLPPDWDHFLEDFCAHWPTGEEFIYVDFVRDGLYGRGAQRSGNPRWRRLAEIRCGAKSVFHFDVPGSVANSTHAGLPGCFISAAPSAQGSTSGRTMAGISRPPAPRSWKSTPPFAATPSLPQA